MVLRICVKKKLKKIRSRTTAVNFNYSLSRKKSAYELAILYEQYL